MFMVVIIAKELRELEVWWIFNKNGSGGSKKTSKYPANATLKVQFTHKSRNSDYNQVIHRLT